MQRHWLYFFALVVQNASIYASSTFSFPSPPRQTPAETRREKLEKEAARATQPRSASILQAAAVASPRPGAPDATGRKPRPPPPAAKARSSSDGDGGSGSDHSRRRAVGTVAGGSSPLESSSALLGAGLVTAALRGEPRRYKGEEEEPRGGRRRDSNGGGGERAKKPPRESRRDGRQGQLPTAVPPQTHFEGTLHMIQEVRETIRERQVAEKVAVVTSGAAPSAGADGGSRRSRLLLSPRVEGARNLSAAFSGAAAGGAGGGPSGEATPRSSGRTLGDLKVRARAPVVIPIHRGIRLSARMPAARGAGTLCMSGKEADKSAA